MALEFSKKSIVLLVGKYVPLNESIHHHLLRSDQYISLNDLEATWQHVCVVSIHVSGWYRKFFDTEKAVPR